MKKIKIKFLVKGQMKTLFKEDAATSVSLLCEIAEEKVLFPNGLQKSAFSYLNYSVEHSEIDKDDQIVSLEYAVDKVPKHENVEEVKN